MEKGSKGDATGAALAPQHAHTRTHTQTQQHAHGISNVKAIPTFLRRPVNFINSRRNRWASRRKEDTKIIVALVVLTSRARRIAVWWW